MGRARRLAWVADGSPFHLCRPVSELMTTLRGYGYTVYGIGNVDHLEHDPPEDHTPYSATGWPGQAVYGVGYAVDIMPPPAGLPSLQQLGAQLFADRQADHPGVRWLKYMNWEPQRDGGGPCYQDSWQPSHYRESSSDRGHIHASAATGFETSTIAGYDPVARIRGDDDMPLSTEQDAKLAQIAAQVAELHDRITAWQRGMSISPAGRKVNPVIWQQRTESWQASASAVLAELGGRDWVDEAAIVDGVLTGLGSRPPAEAAAALVAAFGAERAAEIGVLLVAPEPAA